MQCTGRKEYETGEENRYLAPEIPCIDIHFVFGKQEVHHMTLTICASDPQSGLEGILMNLIDGFRQMRIILEKG